MKVCISSYGPTLDSRVQPIFGRCEYFIFVDPDNMEPDVEPNPYSSSPEDAGVKSAEMIVQKGARKVFASQVGEKARKILEDAGVDIVTMEGHTVRQVLEAFRGHS